MYADTSFLEGITPIDIGLPSKFSSFRPVQLEMIANSLQSTKRFVVHSCPTGGGKSAAVIAEHFMTTNRTAILTSTKSLQHQYMEDFEECGLVSVKGKSNFTCCKSTPLNPMTCEEGAQVGCGASKKGGSCPYRRQYEAALQSPLVTTNYAYWCLIHRYGKGLGGFETLVLDEAHTAPNHVGEQVNITFSVRESDMLRVDWPSEWRSIPQWKSWAQTHAPVAKTVYEKVLSDCARGDISRDTIRNLMAWKRLSAKLQTIASMEGQWVVEQRMARGRHDGYRLQAVWPYTYAEKLLFLGVPKIILVSATINRKTLDLLGVKKSYCDFFEYGSTFDPKRSPVYFIPTVALSHKTGDDEFNLIVARVDEILSTRLDRKGIIHTTSYARAKAVMEKSEYSYFMLLNESQDTASVVERFKLSEPPSILVSPSVTTGWDFPLTQCEYQIIVKAPYPDLRSAVQMARKEADWSYPTYEMSQALVQSCGRGMRSSIDRCETFVIDDTVDKTYKRVPGMFPKWFRDQVVKTDTVPEPPTPLIEELLSGDEPHIQELADADQEAVSAPDEEFLNETV